MILRKLSLAQRLTIITVSFVVIVWAVAATEIWTMADHDLNELLDAHLAQTAALLATGEVDDGDSLEGQGDGILKTPILMHKYQSRVAFQIWHDQRLLARSTDAPNTPLADVNSRGFSNNTINGSAWRVFSAVRERHGLIHDKVYVGELISARNDILKANLRGGLAMLLTLPLLIIGIIWIVRNAVQPLRELSDSVTQRQPHALDPLPTDDVLPEVKPLVKALNGLFKRVDEQLASEQRFTADAAHELRTPIAAIRIQAQVAQGATNQEERDTALTATITGCDRATHLVEQLLQLARVEAQVNGALTLAPDDSQCDLVGVVADCVRQLTAKAAAREQKIESQTTDELVLVPINATLAIALLRNLLDNALRYSPEGARVRIQLDQATSKRGPRLTVEDSGPGMPPDARSRLGERFFRQLGTTQSGSGLGWSIVLRVARLHDLSVKADESPEMGGLRVQVTWPSEQEPTTLAYEI
jgi:two-component system sensor histidine kinase QseC